MGNRDGSSGHNHEHHDIGCLAAIEMLYAYLDGELTDAKAVADFEKHLEHCRSCFTRTQMERLLNERLKREAKDGAPGRLKKRLRSLMDEF